MALMLTASADAQNDDWRGRAMEVGRELVDAMRADIGVTPLSRDIPELTASSSTAI
ncbi:MAG TPA: hypothetical protein VIS95_10170 [Solirubrobacterales bacterium]